MKTSLMPCYTLLHNFAAIWFLIRRYSFGQNIPILQILWEPCELTSNGTQEFINHFVKSYHSRFCNFYAKSYIVKCLCSKGEVYKAAHFQQKGKGEKWGFQRQKKVFYIKEARKIAIYPMGCLLPSYTISLKYPCSDNKSHTCMVPWHWAI